MIETDPGQIDIKATCKQLPNLVRSGARRSLMIAIVALGQSFSKLYITYLLVECVDAILIAL